VAATRPSCSTSIQKREKRKGKREEKTREVHLFVKRPEIWRILAAAAAAASERIPFELRWMDLVVETALTVVVGATLRMQGEIAT
jgi:hypothetical protein